MKRRAQLDVFLVEVSRRMERAELTFGDKSYSRDPLELIREVKEELEDVAGWASILWARIDDIERALEALADRQPTDKNGKWRFRKPPIRFANDETREAWEAKAEERLERMRREHIRYAVAPLCVIPTPSGRRLMAGQAVRLADFDGTSTPASALLLKEVRDGTVLVNEDGDDEAKGRQSA